MKLITNVPARLDDTVIATGLPRGLKPGADYTFERDAESGELVCEVADDQDAAFFLALPGERFAPFSEADFAKAESMVEARLREMGQDGDGDDDDDDDDDVDPNAPPIEAGTPPAPAKKKAKAKAAPAA